MVNNESIQQVNLRTSLSISVDKLLDWRDPHCPDSVLLQEEFSYVDNEVELLLDIEAEIIHH